MVGILVVVLVLVLLLVLVLVLARPSDRPSQWTPLPAGLAALLLDCLLAVPSRWLTSPACSRPGRAALWEPEAI